MPVRYQRVTCCLYCKSNEPRRDEKTGKYEDHCCYGKHRGVESRKIHDTMALLHPCPLPTGWELLRELVE